MQRCKARLDRLALVASVGTPDDPTLRQWSEARVDRVVVDYMLRQGYYESALALAKEADIMVLFVLFFFAFPWFLWSLGVSRNRYIF